MEGATFGAAFFFLAGAYLRKISIDRRRAQNKLERRLALPLQKHVRITLAYSLGLDAPW